jgi:hypothetical protein
MWGVFGRIFSWRLQWHYWWPEILLFLFEVVFAALGASDAFDQGLWMHLFMAVPMTPLA